MATISDMAIFSRKVSEGRVLVNAMTPDIKAAMKII